MRQFPDTTSPPTPSSTTTRHPADGKGLLRSVLGPRGAWLTLVLALLAVAGLMGASSTTGEASRGAQVPASAESSRATSAVAAFPGGEGAPVMVVFARDGDVLSAADRAAAEAAVGRMADAAGAQASPLIDAPDGAAVLGQVMVPGGLSNEQNEELVAEIRQAVGTELPAGLHAEVTGGAAFGADLAGAFAGADLLLLAVTVGIVALLLLITYRSPLLMLVPLVVVALADQLATTLDTWLAVTTGMSFDKGIISVLVFGAGTNYALLLISRYREELRTTTDHRRALVTACRHSAGSIVASNLTVVLALLTLLAAAVPATRGLGLAAAIGLVVALVTVGVLLPAALAVCGRGVFWPFVPRVEVGAEDGSEESVTTAGSTVVTTGSRDSGRGARPGIWFRVAGAVVRRPVVALATTGLLVLGGAALLPGTPVGLDQQQQFRTSTESTRGLDTIAAHYPVGTVAPITVVASSADVEEVRAAVAGVPGIASVRPAGDDGAGRTRLGATGTAQPGSQQAFDQVRAVREAAHAADPGSLVGGRDAEQLDGLQASERDLWTVIPLILLVVVVVLAVLLRSLVAPLVLATINVASSAAALGVGATVGEEIFGFPALDSQVPLLAFLFLVALGIDYTIFLSHRIRQEAIGRRRAPRAAVVQAVGTTGGVITSAGVVLAAVFAALGVLPLVTMFQLGLIVCMGVLLDTLVVRTVLVPAVFTLLGDRMWWPSAAARRRSGELQEPVVLAPGADADPDALGAEATDDDTPGEAVLVEGDRVRPER